MASEALRLGEIPKICLAGKARAREFKFAGMDCDARKEFARESSERQPARNFDACRPLSQEERARM
eukprot:7027436-Alexandrium_andersonii.AAC.1